MASFEKALIEQNEQIDQGVNPETVGNQAHLKDTRFSWFVCSCTFISQVFVLGVLHAFGVFFVEFLKEFNSPKGEAAWIGSLAYGLSMTFGPVTSLLVSRFGYSRVMMVGGVTCSVSLVASSFANSVPVLFFSFSVLYGIGTCMATSPTMTIMGEYFDKHLSIATGITVSGSSFGTLVMGPLSQAIIDVGGWRLAFRVFAGLTMITVVLSSRIRPLPPTGTAKRQKRNILHDLQIWKNRVFVVWTLSITLVMFGFYIPYVHLVSYAIDQGVSPDKASILMMILGATTAFGRIAFGRIVQMGVLNRLHMHQLSMLVTGTGVMLLPLIKSYIGIVMYVITVGLVDGCYVVLLPILTTSLVGIENSVLAWGFMIGTCSITFTMGPPVAGAIYDSTGSYNIAFHCAGVPIVAGALLLFLIPWAQRTSGSGQMLHTLNEYTIQDSGEDGDVRGSESIGVGFDAAGIAMSSCSRRSNVTIKTTGTSPMIPHAAVSDKSTSTDGVSARRFSMDIEDALSQLSYNDRVFDDMIRQSRDSSSTRQHAADISSSGHSIPRIPPPSEPVRYRHADGSRHGSIHSHYSGTSSIRDRPSAGSHCSQPLAPSSMQHTDPGSLLIDHLSLHEEPNSGVSSYAHSASINSGMLESGLPLPLICPPSTDPLNIMQNLQQRSQGPDESTSSKSANQSMRSSGRESPSQGTSQREPGQDGSNFDQTISDQVTILRETLQSPVQVDSITSEDLLSAAASAEVQQLGIMLPEIYFQGPTPDPSPAPQVYSRGPTPDPSPALNIFSRGPTPDPSQAQHIYSRGPTPDPSPAPNIFSRGPTPDPSPAPHIFSRGPTPDPSPALNIFSRGPTPDPSPAPKIHSQGPTLDPSPAPKIHSQGPTPDHSPAPSTMSMPQSIPSLQSSTHDAALFPEPLEAETSGTQALSSPKPGTSAAHGADFRFATDNQVTVIPGTNPFKEKEKSGSQDSAKTKLEGLFKPIEEDGVTANESFELLDASKSTRDVTKTKSSGELDVFKHLFTDEET